jgi:predicted DNA-binding transcriptional regulator AlpA
MRIDSSGSGTQPATNAPAASTSISKWVNEPPPALNQLLTAHDTARLTRRPGWLLVGLSLIGKFPKTMRFRGRRIGWCRAEVLRWMSQNVPLEQDALAARLHAAREAPGMRAAAHRPTLTECSQMTARRLHLPSPLLRVVHPDTLQPDRAVPSIAVAYHSTKDLCTRFRCSSRTLFRRMKRSDNPFPKPCIRHQGSENLWAAEEIAVWERQERELTRLSYQQAS